MNKTMSRKLKKRGTPYNSDSIRKRRPKVTKIRLKTYIFPFLLILLLAGLIPIGQHLLTAWNRWDYLKIRHIDIIGNNRISLEQIKNWGGIKEGLNILSLDLDHITGLAEAQPWIRSLEVERRFPGSVSIHVEESSPVAIWEDEGKHFSMDEFGILLEEIDEETSFAGLPILVGFKQGISKEGARCPSPYWPSGLNVMENIKDVFPELMEDIEKFCILSENQMVIFLNKGRRILLNMSDANVKLRLLKALIEQAPDHWQSMEYCDLRFEDKIVFG